MFVILRTGEVFGLSAAGFAVVTAAVLAQDHSPPEIAGQLRELFRQRHRLVEIRQEVAQGGFCHQLSLLGSRNLLLQLFGIQIHFHVAAVRAGARLSDGRRSSDHPGLFLGYITGRITKADLAFIHRFVAFGAGV